MRIFFLVLLCTIERVLHKHLFMFYYFVSLLRLLGTISNLNTLPEPRYPNPILPTTKERRDVI